MAQSARFFTDVRQASAGYRTSESMDAITESIRSVLSADEATIPRRNLVAPNFDDEASRVEQQDWGTRPVHPAMALPNALPSAQGAEVPDRFTLLQKWEGTVLASAEHEFTAILRDKGEPDEEATFDVEEVPEGDRPLIAPGAVFHWSIGYRDRRGQRTRESIICFRRLPAWTRRELDRAAQEADETISALHWGEPDPARRQRT